MEYLNYVQHDLCKIMHLLRIGFMCVSKNLDDDENVIMRATYQLAEDLHRNINKHIADNRTQGGGQ